MIRIVGDNIADAEVLRRDESGRDSRAVFTSSQREERGNKLRRRGKSNESSAVSSRVAVEIILSSLPLLGASLRHRCLSH